jgi:hypothetical protein
MTTSKLPFRQKALMTLTIVAGFTLTLCGQLKMFSNETLQYGMIFFSFCIPMYLLASDAVIDLNIPNVFNKWLGIGVLFAAVSFICAGNKTFLIERDFPFDQDENPYGIVDYSTSSMKSILAFLIVYWPLNRLLKATKGKYVINTFRQVKWYNETARRNIYGFDVVINIILLVTIFLACIFGY